MGFIRTRGPTSLFAQVQRREAALAVAATASGGAKPLFAPSEIRRQRELKGPLAQPDPPVNPLLRGFTEGIKTVGGFVTRQLPSLAVEAAVGIPAGLAISATRGGSVGFLSSIGKFFGGAIRAVGRAVGILPAAAQRVAAAAPRAAAVARRAAPFALAAGAGALGATALSALGGDIDPDTPGVQLRGGNGRETTITLIQTFDNATGTLIRQDVRKGRPFLMRRDLTTAKRVNRVLGKEAAKRAARNKGPSKTKQLTEAIVGSALTRALTSGCPPVPCPS